MFKRIIKEDDGNSALEYGLIAALIAVAIIIAVRTLGTSISNTFDEISNAL